ncbi:MAG TPA: HEAT repeat domain-containing protein [Ktedonobacterales bacterium]|nr:HEAT repeat domain-containing protein [Ktedonobacterales bacterium]
MAKGRETADSEAGYRGSSAPPVVAPEWRNRLYIDRPADLHELARTLSRASVVAIDAEFMQPRIHNAGDPSHRLSLLQFAIENGHRTSWVVDALRLYDLSPLRTPLESPQILKLFHGISADARMLATRGLVARHYLDLEAVSRSIFGQRESGLQAMLQRACSVRLDKSLQRADWGRRPLTTAMVAYAARDAQMTYVLYGWLRDNYPWALALHEVDADETTPDVAEWLRPFLNGGRGRSVEMAVAEAGLSGKTQMVMRDLRAALAMVRHPTQRIRLLRIIGELGLKGMVDDLRPYLISPASEERASAVRALGRLHDAATQPTLQALAHDPVEDVRQAVRHALEHRASPAASKLVRDGGVGKPTRWTSGEDDAALTMDPWQAALRARFGADDNSDENHDDDSCDNAASRARRRNARNNAAQKGNTGHDRT